MMELHIQSTEITDYLGNIDGIIELEDQLIVAKVQDIIENNFSLEKQAEIAFQFVRDQIEHSFDTKSKRITISASDTIKNGEGICFAKSHLLAALLRGLGIPTGFCYQRVLRKGTIESGYALHGLNALYLEEHGWFRVDPRGNKPGIQSEFNMEEEQLAYPIREHLGEVDYPQVYTKPLETVINSMEDSEDCHALFFNRPEKVNNKINNSI